MADITDATFQTAVIDRSATVPVVVDLWAPWCGPCKTLGPILERVIGATNGAVELAKINVDENPGISQAFQVQSIPAVYAISGGEVVDQFMGAQGEREVEAFVAKLIPEGAAAEPEAPDVGDLDEAGLRQILEATPDDPAAITALAQLLASDGRGEEALALIAKIPETPDTRRIAALVRTGGLEEADQVEARLNALLDQVKTNDEARQEFVDILEVMGPDDPRTADYRRQLTSRLF